MRVDAGPRRRVWGGGRLSRCIVSLPKPLSHYFDYSVASMTMFGHVNVNDNVWSRKHEINQPIACNPGADPENFGGGDAVLNKLNVS